MIVATNLLAVSVIALATLLRSVDGEIVLEISQIPDFPLSANKSFKIEIVPKSGDKLTDNFADTMVIMISDETGKEIEKAIFDYGFKDMIEQEFKGQLMRIPVWQRTTGESGASMMVEIVFKRLANGRRLEIYQIVAINPRDRRERLNNLQMASRIYHGNISLLIPPKLDLTIRSEDGRKGELMLDQLGIVTCRSYDGVPQRMPRWVNADSVKVVGSTYNENKNERELKIKVTILDHMKNLECRAGETVSGVTIIVLHHPSQVVLEPDMGSMVENGSTTSCSSIDGFPIPQMGWELIKGPPNASLYYEISKDGKNLHLKAETPIGTKWKFNCTASNVLPRSHGIFNRTVSFTIGRQQEGLFGLNLTLQIMIGVAVMGAIIIFCVVIVFIVCIARRSCAGQSESRNSRRNGGPVKSAAEKKEITNVLLVDGNMVFSDEIVHGRTTFPPRFISEPVIQEKKYDSIVLQNKAQINQIKNILDVNINLPDYHWSLDTKTLESSSEKRYFHWHKSEIKITAEFQSKKLVLFLYLNVFVENIKFNATVILYKSQRPQEFISDTKLVTLEYTGHRSPPFIFNQSVVEQFKYKNSIVLKVFLTKL